jgi:hypothetical protein
MPALIFRQRRAIGRIGHHVYLIRCGYLRIPMPVQYLSQGAGSIGLEMAQLKPGLPGMDSDFVSDEAKERVALRLEGSKRVRHLRPYHLHGKGGINGDEYSPGMACEVYMVNTAQHPIQPEEHHTPEQKLFHAGLRYISALSNAPIL